MDYTGKLLTINDIEKLRSEAINLSKTKPVGYKTELLKIQKELSDGLNDLYFKMAKSFYTKEGFALMNAVIEDLESSIKEIGDLLR